ncbi:MAG: hypothetical protein J7M38_03790 [Armatimonadetes bacterium]|nr:hypothetical protein [Armatimonadota bacterium]
MSSTRGVLLITGSLIAVMSLVGCGGGGMVDNGGGAPAAPAETKYVFRIDFANNTVSTVPVSGTNDKLADANPGGASAEIGLDMTVALSEDGTLGRRHVDATVTNNSSGSIGVNREGTVTGIDLCINSLEFQEDDGTVVDGGGMAGEWATNPLTELPVYHIDEAVAPGATSSEIQLDFILPRKATVAVVDIIVRADTERHQPVRPRRIWVSTVAGQPLITGDANGPAAQARFYHVWGLLYREDEGDLLFCDYSNDVVRRLADGVVTSHVLGFMGSGTPVDLALDAEGNIVIACYNENRIYLAPSGGSTCPSSIAGTGIPGLVDGAGNTARFNRPWGVTVLGDDIYVADYSNKTVRKIHFEGGNRFSSANYTVSTVYTDTVALADVAFDHLGNMYIARYNGNQILMIPKDSTTSYVIAGTGTGGHDDGLGDAATFYQPCSLAVCPDGTLYVVDQNSSLRRVRYIGGVNTQSSSWRVDTVLDDAASAADGDEGDATSVSLHTVWVAADGVVWLGDDNAVRRLELRPH